MVNTTSFSENLRIFAISKENNRGYEMEEQTFMDLIYQSMQDSAREARLSLGRPSSHATLEEALQQVAMLKAAKDAAQPIGK